MSENVRHNQRNRQMDLLACRRSALQGTTREQGRPDSPGFLRKYPGGVFSCDEGEGNAFVDDLVVSIQPIDIRGVIFRWIIRPNVVWKREIKE